MCRGRAEMAGHLLGVWAGQGSRRHHLLLEHPSRGTCSSAPGLRHVQLHCLGSWFSQGSSVRGVSSAAQHNPKTKQPKRCPPNERALPLHSVLREKGVPWSMERQGQCGHCTLVLVQNCTLTCQQPEIINKASLKRQWSLMGILVAFPAPSREVSMPGSHSRSAGRRSSWGQLQLSSKPKVINMGKCGS